ncbi:MAG: hypothetical protein R3220_04925 [Balneolaceae bacterium]|nr:hypothetical protein [Balneolaceae bacterium]
MSNGNHHKYFRSIEKYMEECGTQYNGGQGIPETIRETRFSSAGPKFLLN